MIKEMTGLNNQSYLLNVIIIYQGTESTSTSKTKTRKIWSDLKL